MNLSPEMEKYLKRLKERQFPTPPRKTSALGTGLELYSPETHLAFSAATYIVFSKYLHDHGHSTGRILDLGCGTGYGTFQLRELLDPGSSIIGCDRSQPLTEYAGKYYSRPGLRFLAAEAGQLPFNSGSIKTVISVSSIIHNMTEIQTRRCLKEISRVLTPDGVFLFSTPNRDFSQELYHENLNNNPQLRFSILNRHEYTEDELKSLLQAERANDHIIFNDVSIGGISNLIFRSVWTESILEMRRRRFKETGGDSIISRVIRRLLPAEMRTRYFLREIERRRREMKISLPEIARGARYYTDNTGIAPDYFLVIAKKAG